MKAITYTLFALLIIACACVMTCPDKSDHTDALKEIINDKLAQELVQKTDAEPDDGITILGSMIGTGIAGLFLDGMLQVDNYFVCSVGRIKFEGEEYIVSIGVLNHVFTLENKNTDGTGQD